MKYYTLSLSLCFAYLTHYCQATYKIVITYDANGNRIKRERVCTNCLQGINTQVHLTTEVKIYPNPANKFCSVEIPSGWLAEREECLLTISDVTGKILISHPLKQISNHIDLSLLVDGAYLFSVKVGNSQKHIEKIIKITD